MSFRVHLVLFRLSRLELSLEHPCRPNAKTRLYSVKSRLPSSPCPETPFTPHPIRGSEFSGLRGSLYRLTSRIVLSPWSFGRCGFFCSTTRPIVTYGQTKMKRP